MGFESLQARRLDPLTILPAHGGLRWHGGTKLSVRLPAEDVAVLDELARDAGLAQDDEDAWQEREAAGGQAG